MSFILAIDGTSGSGKTTTARMVAKRLGWFYLDTGATYRAITYEILRRGIDPEDKNKVTQILENLELDVRIEKRVQRTYINGKDITDYLREHKIDRAVTPISKMKVVRKYLVKLQREIAENKNIVVEGRDIGTVVFPNANLKIFMDADPEERAKRRKKQIRNQKDLESIKKDLLRRDYHDSKRKESPLKRAQDALVLDTTSLTIKEQVDWVISKIKQLDGSSTPV
jgi:cytidylate kinase